MYESIGVLTNVWGTGIRDAAIDFRELARSSCSSSAALAAAKWALPEPLADAHSTSFLVQWLFYSPFTSPITHRPYQAGLFFPRRHFIELEEPP